MSKEAMKLALRSIRELVLDESDDAPALQGARMRKQKAEKALREALAEQPVQQEPVAWEQFYPDIGKPQIAFNAEVIGYVAPQRKPLTDEEIWKFWWARPEVGAGEDDSMEAEFVAAVRAVLAAHGIKEKTND